MKWKDRYTKEKMAMRILLGIAIVFLLCAAAKIFIPGNGSDAVWNFASYVLPPLATLITGYYFGYNSTTKKEIYRGKGGSIS